jgi:hypothetical protein
MLALRGDPVLDKIVDRLSKTAARWRLLGTSASVCSAIARSIFNVKNLKEVHHGWMLRLAK